MKQPLCFFLLLCITLISCAGKSESSLAKENEALRQRIQNDSIALDDMGSEMEEVDRAINEILAFTSTASQGGAEAPDKKAKIKEIQNLIHESTDRIMKLESDLKNSNSSFKNSSALLQSLESQKKMIAEQQKIIEQLTGEVNVLTDANNTLKSSVNGLSETVNNQTGAIQQYQREISSAQQKLNDLNRQISSVNTNADNINKQINNEYFAIAKTLVEMAEDRKGFFKNAKEQRKSLTIKAMQYYCKLDERGVYAALSEITALKSHPELGKFVVNESCQSIKNR